MRGKADRAVCIGVVVMMAALGVSACGESKSGGAGGDGDFALKVGSLVPLTGSLASFGPPGRKAADLAVQVGEDALKKAGLKATFAVEHADTQGDPQAAIQAARKLVAGGASCLDGAYTSAETIAVGNAVAVPQRVPLIAPSASAPVLSGLEDDDFVWRTSASDALGAVALAKLVERDLGAPAKTTVALAARDDAYGQGFIEQFKTAWEQRGGSTTGPVLYDPNQASFNSEAARIVSGKPDAFVIIDFPETYAKMGAALARTGQFSPDRLFSNNGLGPVAEGEKAPAGIPPATVAGARGHRPWTPAGGAAVKAFDELYRNAGGPPRHTYDAQSFDSSILCLLAAVAAGSNDGSAIKGKLRDVSGPPGKKFSYLELPEALRTLHAGQDIDYEGVSGPIDFDKRGDPTVATFQVWKYDQAGRLRITGEIQGAAGKTR